MQIMEKKGYKRSSAWCKGVSSNMDLIGRLERCSQTLELCWKRNRLQHCRHSKPLDLPKAVTTQSESRRSSIPDLIPSPCSLSLKHLCLRLDPIAFIGYETAKDL
ncbi:hypothetical protein YC2023_072534 [Brassica napus]